MVLSERGKNIKVFVLKKLNAYTIIEGIVSMVILSIVLTISMLIFFNFYRSYATYREVELKSALEQKLDSLLFIRQLEKVSWYDGEGNVYIYQTEPFEDFENVYRANLSVIDSIRIQGEVYNIFYLNEED